MFSWNDMWGYRRHQRPVRTRETRAATDPEMNLLHYPELQAVPSEVRPRCLIRPYAAFSTGLPATTRTNEISSRPSDHSSPAQ
jgi:hypothetical protein